MKRTILVFFVFITGFFAFSKDIPQKLDVLLDLQQNPETLFIETVTKSKKTNVQFASFIEKYSSIVRYQDQITFFYLLEKPAAKDKLFVFTNIEGTERGVEMVRIGKTGAFYKSIQVPQNQKFITYSFRKATGHFLHELNNPLVYCDARKSSLIRLSDSVGGFVQVSDYEKGSYKKLVKRVNTVYLPAAYFKNPQQQFPVIYWLDSQNLWDNQICPYGGWRIDTTLEQLINEGKCKPFIIAGLANSKDRTPEYAGWAKGTCEESALEGYDISDYPLIAKEHGQMVINDYIPFIEKNFRVIKNQQNRFIAGSSYGAFESAWLLETYPETFAGAGLFSGGGHGYQQLIEQGAFKNASYKIYMDCGTFGQLEKYLIEGTRNMKAYLLSLGYGPADFLYQECVGQDHNELAWSLRVPDFLQFISK